MVLLAVYEMRGWGIVLREEEWVVINGMYEGILWCVECWLGRGLGGRPGQFRKGFCQVMFGGEGEMVV